MGTQGINSVGSNTTPILQQDEFPLDSAEISLPLPEASFFSDSQPDPLLTERYSKPWYPTSWQFFVSSDNFSVNGMAGFFQGRFNVSDLQDNGDGTFTLTADGFSTARERYSFEAGLAYSQKQPLFKVFEKEGRLEIAPIPGGYHQAGPGIYLTLSHQAYLFTDHSYAFDLSTQQLSEIFDDTSVEILDQFDTEVPLPEDLTSEQEVQEYYDNLEEWVNGNADGASNIPGLIKGMFDDYDPAQDVTFTPTSSDEYLVKSTKLTARGCLESNRWLYGKRVQVFNGGGLCLQGSALHFTSPAFESKTYFGLGPYFEVSLVEYHHKPFHKPSYYGLDDERDVLPTRHTTSFYFHSQAMFYKGFDFHEGLSPDNYFLQGDMGVSLRVTFPSVRTDQTPREIINSFENHPIEMDLDDIP